jgi:two-component system sensor histidine kinase HydH
MALYSEQAQFIGRQAKIHAVIAGIAILALLGLAFYFVRTLNRFLALKKREESEKQLAALGAMSATLAHEIRNPLGAMKGLTQVVQEDLPEGHRSQELMKTVVEEAKRLEQLVTDLLTFARPAELRLTDFNLTDLITEVASLLTPQADEAGVAVDVPDKAAPVMIRSDSDGLKQILLNLVINAIEVTPGNGSVSLRLVEESKSNQVVVSILDDGPGLGGTNPAELFQPFKTTKLKGSGLGLAVTKQIVERLGGSVTLENHSGGGTICTLRVPIKPPPLVGVGKQ